MYNRMMLRRGSLIALSTLIALALPSIAHAYVGPEEVLFEEEFMMPATNRQAEARARAQAEESRMRRDQEQAKVIAEQHPEEEDELATILSALTQAIEDVRETDPDTAHRRNARLAERVELRQSTVDTINSGAPLIGTGPESALATLVIVVALCWTLWKARRMEG